MNEQALQDSFDLFTLQGYNGNIDSYKKLISSNEEAFNDAFSLFRANGYEGDSNQFKILLGVENQVKINGFTSTDPTVESIEDTGSKLETGLLERKPIEKNTWLEDWFGEKEDEEDKLFGFVDLVSDMYRAAKRGIAAGSSVNEAYDLLKLGNEMTDEQFEDFVKAGRVIEETGVQKEQMEASNRVVQLKKEGYSDLGAIMTAYWENPSAIFATTVSSLATMASSLFDSEEVRGFAAAGAGAGAAAGAAGGAGVGALFGGVGAGPGAVVGAKLGAASGFMSGISGAMETGLTMADLTQSLAKEKGKAWETMSDKERINWLKEVTSDKELFDDLKSKAISRGITIGAVDYVTNVATLGVGKGVSSAISTSARSATTGLATTLAKGTVETIGGSASEFLGQKAAGQEYNLEEIVLEGLGGKEMTLTTIRSDIKKGTPTYKLNGQKLNGKQMSEALKIMDDEAYVNAKIEIENSPSVQKIVDNRRLDIKTDLKVDSRINDIADRAEAIKLQKEIDALGKAEGNKIKKKQLETKLAEIESKYENSEIDATIEQRKQSIAEAVENKFETEFNKNYKALKDKEKDTGIEPLLFEDDSSFFDAVTQDSDISKEQLQKIAPNGVFIGNGKIYINKAEAKRSIDIATGNIGEISVASHEVLHPIFNALIGGAKEQSVLVKQFEKQMTSQQKAYVNQQLKKRGYTKQERATEFMNVFSDGIIKGDINYDQTTFEKLGNAIVDFFRSTLGLSTNELSFKDGRGVYNFLKEYNTSIKKGELSEKAIKAIQETEKQKGVKVSEAKALENKQFSKTLSPDVETDLTSKILEVKKLAKENEEIAKKFGKDPIPGAKQIRLENEIRQGVKPIIEKIVTNRTKALYDPIAPDQKRNVSREEFQDSMRTDIETMILNEFKEGGNTLEKFIVDRSYLRANDLAKRLGIEDKIKTSLSETDSEGKPTIQIADDYDSGATLEEIRSEEGRQKKLINPINTLGEKLSKEYIDAVEAEVQNITPEDIADLSFAKIKDLAPEVTAKFWGTTVKKVTTASANLATTEIPGMQNIILENANTFIKLLPEGAILEGDAASEKLIGTGLGIPRKLQQAFYDKHERTSKGAGLIPFKLKNNITKKEFLEAFGIKEDGTFESFNGKDPRAQTILALIRLFGQLTSNTAIRQAANLTDAQKADIKAGAAAIQFSKTNYVNKAINIPGYADSLFTIQFSKAARDRYEDQLKKKRPDLKDPSKAIDQLFEWADNLNVKENKKAKYKNLALYYMANGYLILPEDGYKVIDAIRIGEVKKIDPYSFKNPNELLAKYDTPSKVKAINPDTVKTLSNKKELDNGITVYNVEESKEAQSDVRKIIDSNWGEKANPWCLAARKEGKSELRKQAWQLWEQYGPNKKIAFKNGKLLSFWAGDKWWDRMDAPTEKLTYTESTDDGSGLKKIIETDTKNNTSEVIGYQKGDFKGSFYAKYNANKKLIEKTERNGKNNKLYKNHKLTKEFEDFINGIDVEQNAMELPFFKEKDNILVEIEDAWQTYDTFDSYKKGEIMIPDSLVVEQIHNADKGTNSYIDTTKFGNNTFKIYRGSNYAFVNYDYNGKKYTYVEDLYYSFGEPIFDVEAFDLEQENPEYKGVFSAVIPVTKDNNIIVTDPRITEYLTDYGKSINKATNNSELQFSKTSDIIAKNNEIQFSKGLRKAFGLKNKDINFKNREQLENARAGLIEVFKKLKEKGYTSGEVANMFIGTARGSWGKLGEKYIPNKVNKLIEIVYEETTGKVRYNKFLMTGAADFFTLLNEVFKNAKYQSRSAYIIEGKNTYNLDKVPSQSPNGFVSGAMFKGNAAKNSTIFERELYSKKQKENLEILVNVLKEMYDKGELTSNQTAMILATLGSSTNGLIRTAAKLVGYSLQSLTGKLTDKMFRYEHSQPASVTIVELAKFITDKNYPYSFQQLMDGFNVYIIPKKYDKIINKFYSSKSPVDENGNLILSDEDKIARYNDPAVKKAIKKAGLPTLKIVQFSKSQTTGLQFSKNLNEDFNNIIEDSTGIESFKRFSEAKGKVRGRNKGRFKFFIPPSADDFAGLLYNLTAKGTKGEAAQAWFKENLFDPFSRGINEFERYKQRTTTLMRDLKKKIKNVPEGLKKINETGFKNEDAVRVYLWAKKGVDIPGLSKTDQKELIKIINDNPKLKEFAEQIDALVNGYPEPQNDWLAGTITTDIINLINTSKREEFLAEWQANVDEVFSEENINKLRAAFGDNYVEALQDMLYRMKNGRNRPFGANKLTNQFMNWVNDSVGTIMFFNTRSALLQTLSMANFINWSDNNPIMAAKAFANQKQFWSDFAMLFNSDFLKQRRSGLKNDVNADDIAAAAETSQNKAKAVLSAMLKMGFLPTQIADSFAIAIGGASFVRNRINAYISKGMDQASAEKQAFLDFQEVTEENQQSSRPDKISQQQASPLGRIILAFANTPMQYMRLTKKAFLDLKNGRGDVKTNISKLVYYFAVQNIIFSSLQAALFAVLFEDEDDEEIDKKQLLIANSMLDSILRGVGIYGAVAATLKNVTLEVKKQAEKDRPDFTIAAQRALSISPPVDSKMRKLMSAGRAFSYKTTREKMKGFGLDNPAYYATGQVISATTNVPVDRMVRKADNIRVALDNDTKYWQKVALLLGYSQWDVGMVETSKDKKKKSKFGSTTKWKNREWKKRKWKE